MAPAAGEGGRLGATRPLTLWALIAVAAVLIIVFAALVARHLTNDARAASESYARVFRGLASPREGGATEALLQQADEIRREGIPIVVTTGAGVATDTANLPHPIKLDSPEMRAFVAALDADNPPVIEPSVGTIHFGTPLTSLAGWIEQLRTRPDPAAVEIAEHLAADYRRLDRVSRRFERIGRPPRRERVDVGALAVAAAAYFRPRLPKLANPVTIDVRVDSRAPVVEGDSLLLEWALEALVKNSVDALKGRSGRIALTVADEPEFVALLVEDDGPGVPGPLLADLFEPGVTTKTGGWGLGLALTRRIVEEGHGGRVTLEPRSAGARFVMRLPRGTDSA